MNRINPPPMAYLGASNQNALEYQAGILPQSYMQPSQWLNKPRIRVKAWRRPNEDGWLHLKDAKALPNIPLGDRK